MGPADLQRALEGLPRIADPNFLFGTSIGADAGVYRLRDDLALVQTVDFFTPIVDDPYDFGAIAAANALSDCFALGARPVTGLNLVAFPCRLGMDVLKEVLRGGADKMSEAGAVVVGGHSVDDKEPKYGIAVTGVVHPDRMVTNEGARPGDKLILTKKIGTGIITNMAKAAGGLAARVRQSWSGSGAISEAVYREAVESMKTLNNKAGELLFEGGAAACTDITGFGLLGHAADMAEASGVQLEISYQAVPKFDAIEGYAIPGSKGGGERNRQFIRPRLEQSAAVGEQEIAVLCDAQTSGPLLIAVPQERAEAFLKQLVASGCASAAIIGGAVEGSVGIVRVVE